MEKLKLGVVFGGMSTENEVSCVSADSILKNLDKELYEVYPIYIDKNGEWWNCTKTSNEITFDTKMKNEQKLQNKEKIENIINYLKKLDVVFPVLHGLYGEDGTIQGLLEMAKVPYVRV